MRSVSHLLTKKLKNKEKHISYSWVSELSHAPITRRSATKGDVNKYATAASRHRERLVQTG